MSTLTVIRYFLILITVLFIGMVFIYEIRLKKLLKAKENCLVEEVEGELLKLINKRFAFTIFVIVGMILIKFLVI